MPYVSYDWTPEVAGITHTYAPSMAKVSEYKAKMVKRFHLGSAADRLVRLSQRPYKGTAPHGMSMYARTREACNATQVLNPKYVPSTSRAATRRQLAAKDVETSSITMPMTRKAAPAAANAAAKVASASAASSSSSLYSRNLFAGALLGIGGGAGGGSAQQHAAAAQDLVLHDEGFFTLPLAALATLLPAGAALGQDEDNAFGVAASVEMFNVVELCTRYCDRLGKDLFASAQAVFLEAAGAAPAASSSTTSSSSASSSGGHHAKDKSSGGGAADADKLKLCRENFERARAAFHNVSDGDRGGPCVARRRD